MIRYAEALDLLRSVASGVRPETEVVPLAAALGRVAAADLASPEAVPPFDNSAMDGFAVRSAATRAATPARPAALDFTATLGAGELLARPAGGDAIEIMTGAPLPEGFDAVFKIEDVAVDREAGIVRVPRPAVPRENVRAKASDYEPGQPVVAAGTTLRPRHLLALAAVGVAQVPVRRLPRVGLVATGRELVAPEAPALGLSQIRNSTAPYLAAAFAEQGIPTTFYGIVADDPAHYRRVLDAMREAGVDLIVSTGAVSVGRYDFVTSVLAEAGAETLFHKCAVRPGKPICFARLPDDGPVLFGVPGNPIATAVGKRFFVDPFLRARLGLPAERPRPATLATAAPKPEGLRCFFKGVYREDGTVECLEGQASYLVRPLVQATGWIELPEEGASTSAGSPVGVYPLTDRGEESPWA